MMSAIQSIFQSRPIQQKYEVVNSEYSDESVETTRHDQSHRTCTLLKWVLFTTFILFINALLWTKQSAQACQRSHLQPYSPLQHLIQYHRIRFNQGLFGEKTEYMGIPTESTEQAWQELAEHGMIKLDEAQAMQLEDRTAFDDEEGYYVAGVEMWHQLHCLNMLRRHIWASSPSSVREQSNEKMQHIDHCIDYLRQVLICHGDVGIVPFRKSYDPSGDLFQPVFNATKSCRRYEPLLQWVDMNQAGDNTPDGPPVQ